MTKSRRRAAVIGAGVSGLNCARHLKACGWLVDVFEKSRGLGGRLAAKRIEGLGSVDLGAQFMTVRTPELQALFATPELKAHTALWPARIAYIDAQAIQAATVEERWIGIPGMNAWLEALWPRSEIKFNLLVEKITQTVDGFWQINNQTDQLYDCVICAIPPPQAAALFLEPQWRGALSAIVMQPCWAALAELNLDEALPFDAAFVRIGGLDWLAANHTKVGRTQNQAIWTLHAKAEVSRQLLESSSDELKGVFQSELTALLNRITGKKPRCEILMTHRWRYAAPELGRAPGIVWRADLRLGACGDWAVGGRVEGAFTSGYLMAEAVLRDL